MSQVSRSIRRAIWCAAALASLPMPSALAGEVRMRAREHYETISILDADRSYTYAGFTNTINLWYEEPYHYAIGLAGSPLFATLRTPEPPAGGSNSIRLVHLGAEAKAFPLPDALPLFARFGVYDASLSSYRATGPVHGWSALGGFGYEIDLGGVGLAPEMAFRWGELGGGLRLFGTAPAIGLHFYKAL